MKLNSVNDSMLFKKGEKCTITVFPIVESMLTGVSYIYHTDNKYMLVYTDNTAEETTYDSEDKNFQESLFSFVGTIQDHARKTDILSSTKEG